MDSPPFGQRYLVDEQKVFQHNAWDNVPMTQEDQEEALKKIEQQRANPVSAEEAERLVRAPSEQWDSFYRQHTSSFFMDRLWVARELPELAQALTNNNHEGPVRVLDVGCGVGNTTFPLMQALPSPHLFIYACDYSPVAVEIMRSNPLCTPERCHPFVWDITTKEPTITMEEGSIDFILCVYVLSALEPSNQRLAIANLTRLLKPGGMLFLKDYGRLDLTQLRFKSNRFISDHFYRRGDDTLVYYFQDEELHQLLEEAGLEKVQNMVDNRLIVNRASRQTMHRVWLQLKYVKRVSSGGE